MITDVPVLLYNVPSARFCLKLLYWDQYDRLSDKNGMPGHATHMIGVAEGGSKLSHSHT